MLYLLSVLSSGFRFNDSNYDYTNTNTNSSSHLYLITSIDHGNKPKNNIIIKGFGISGEKDLNKAKA